MKYLPPELLVYRETHDADVAVPRPQDSLIRLYRNNATFIMTVAPTDHGLHGRDVMTRGVASRQQFLERLMIMNFDVGEYISMKTPHGEAHPVLAHFENTYGIRKERNLILTFTDHIDGRSIFDADTVDISFVDKVFDTGIHHFLFETKDLRLASELFPSDSR